MKVISYNESGSKKYHQGGTVSGTVYDLFI